MNRRSDSVIRFLLIVLVLGLYFKFTRTIFDFYLSDIKAGQSKKLLLAADYVNSLQLAKEAVSLNPNEPYYYRLRAQSYLMNSLFLEEDSKDNLKKLALADLKYSEKLNPKNLATLRNNLPFYYYLALDNFTQSTENSVFDEFYRSESERYLNYLKITYPTDAGVLVSISHYEKLLNLVPAYEETLSIVRELRPDLLDWHPLIVE